MFSDLFTVGGLTLDRLRHFCEIAEAGSIKDAVDLYGRNQSSYSRDIQQLESFFGEPLFVQKGSSRSGKRFEGLTPRGDALRHLTIEYFEALTRLVDFRDTPGSIRIGAGETVLQWVICAHLNLIQDAHPGVQICLVNLSAAEAMRGVDQGTLDIGVVDGQAMADAPEGIQALELGAIEYALFLTPEMAEAAKTQSEKELLSSLPLAGLDGLGPSVTTLQSVAKTDGYTLNFAVVLSSFPQVSTALRGGRLAGFLPALAEEDMKEHNLVMLRHPYVEQLSVPISLIWSTRLASLSPSIAVAASSIHAILAGQTVATAR
ncbi:MAG: LysR family transcriptional regulator [Verrucomicrobia bacterium]|jgi:DNA-binding transcriptional LysR family regulator|nr:LysR family transcriptional regulator [Verrucomicrobiota bacterium]